MSEPEWHAVHTTAVTNTSPDSVVQVSLNATPICPNMSNAEFREMIAKCRDAAVRLIEQRIPALTTWSRTEQDRVRTWFGIADSATRQTLMTGMPKLLKAMRELNPEKVVRYDSEENRKLSCVVPPDTGLNDAAVCKPDSLRRYIAVYSHFCTLPDDALWRGCKIKTLIHECSHYVDTFDAVDLIYGEGTGLKYWAMNHAGDAISNADSIACYVAHFDKN